MWKLEMGDHVFQLVYVKMQIAGQLNGSILNYENIAAETGKPNSTIQKWFQILEETLICFKVPSYRPGFKVRESGHPKFYWFDHAVARAAAGIIREPMDSHWRGISLESLILKELMVYNKFSRKMKPIYYYSTPGAGEIDFIIEIQKKTVQKKPKLITLEIKTSKKWKSEYEIPSRQLKAFSQGSVEKMLGIYLGSEILTFSDFQVFPADIFIEKLFAGEFF